MLTRPKEFLATVSNGYIFHSSSLLGSLLYFLPGHDDLHTNISQCSVETYLRIYGIFNYQHTENSLLSLPVK